MASVGRNEPCPCGSGRKYKQCCLHKQKLQLSRSAPGVEPEPTDPDLGEYATDTSGGLTLTGLISLSFVLGFVALVLWLLDMNEVALVVFGVGLFGALIWTAVRKPPPPRDEADNPAAINFGKR